ncbi:MAG: anti-sigma factor family protein [Deltaproteobacteria bacterium]
MAIKSRKREINLDITCTKATSLIANFLTGELDSDTSRAFREYLDICPDCVAFLNTYKKTIEAVQSFYSKLSARTMDKTTHESIKERIKSKIPG